jgi:hypothetical protein
MIEKLKSFGKVEQCEQIGDEYHIKITDGFSINARNTFMVMRLVTDELPQFPTVKQMHTDHNIFHLIIKKHEGVTAVR